MRRRYQRLVEPPVARLNLVSLMDIFTILVFFLLLNSSDVQVLQNAESINLPDSVATRKPLLNVLISIDADSIYVAGEHVMSVSDALAQNGSVLPLLAAALKVRSDISTPEAVGSILSAVTVMGDRSTDYGLLKKIISTCAASDFGRVSLAVNQITPVIADAARVNAGGL
jgi:biopolymer transport protein TolR